MGCDFFSKIPNVLFLSKSNIDDSIFKSINDDRLILIFDYLYINTNRVGECMFTINDIVKEYGYVPNKNKGKINDKFKNIIIKMSEMGVLKFDNSICISNMKNNELYKCFVNNDIINYDNEFILLYRSELKKIMNCKCTNKLVLLKLFCYLKMRIWKRNGNDMERFCKAEVCYPTYELINNDLGISKSVIKKYISQLEELNLIVCDNAGVYYHATNKNNKRESANTYALYKDDGSHKKELRDGIRFFKLQKESEGYTFCNKQ